VPPVKKTVTKKASTLVLPVQRGKHKKKSEKKYTPSEWARKLQPSLFSPPTGEAPGAAPDIAKPSKRQPLQDTVIFYFGGESTHMGEATEKRMAHVGFPCDDLSPDTDYTFL
jgi:hypothetical protein